MIHPNEDSFENAFREAFDKASLAPPDIIWQNIEQALPPSSPPMPNTGAEGLATSSKLLIGAGAILVSSIAYLYLTDSSTNNYRTELNEIKNETTITKPIEPTPLEPKPETQKLAFVAPFTTQKLAVKSKKELPNMDNESVNLLEKNEEPLESNEYIKNEIFVTEMKPKGMHLPKIMMETPDLVPDTDSQSVTPYYDPNAVIQPNSKPKFWKNIKISGGIRVSN